jgi:CheY-like chemotaxis protein
MMDKPLILFLAEDDPVDRTLFVEAVREIDTAIQCNTANDGEEAIDFLKDPGNPVPDFIFLDLRMPKISGEKCLALIREDTRLKEVPVIIFTTTRELATAENLKKMGASHFMSKPTNIDDVYFLISHVLNDIWD